MKSEKDLRDIRTGLCALSAAIELAKHTELDPPLVMQVLDGVVILVDKLAAEVQSLNVQVRQWKT